MHFFYIIRHILILILIFFFTSFSACYGVGVENQEKSIPIISNIPLPDSLSICDEIVPIDIPVIRERLDREFTILVWDRPQIFLWLKRANRYFPHIEKQLNAAGLPDDLKYLAVAESSLLTHARSPVGATGYWQFMPRTADSQGLRRDRFADERLSMEHSTTAALDYLKKLHEIFGSWSLAMAAYNCGKNRLQRAVDEQKVNDYYRLKLPNETERYIFRIAAIKLIVENHEKYGYRIAGEQLYTAVECDMVVLNISTSIHIADLALAAGTDYKTIRDLNPQFTGYYFPTGVYSIKVPAGSGEAFSEVATKIIASAEMAAKTAENYYTVKKGDTLSHISIRTGVSIKTIKDLNQLKDSTIRPGQRLRLKP